MVRCDDHLGYREMRHWSNAAGRRGEGGLPSTWHMDSHRVVQHRALFCPGGGPARRHCPVETGARRVSSSGQWRHRETASTDGASDKAGCM